MDEQTISARLERTSEGAVLNLSGCLTVWSAAEAKEALSRALGEADRVEVDLAGVETADVTAIQLLCSAHRSAAERSKSVVLRNTGGAVRRLAEDAGLVPRAGCRDGCLWAEEG